MKANDHFFNRISTQNKLSFNLRFAAEHFLGNSFLKKNINRWSKVNQKNIYNDIAGLEKPANFSFPGHKEIAPSTFRSQFLKTGKPVLIKGGAKHWKAFEEWGFDFFKHNYGTHPVYLTNHKDLGDYTNAGSEISNLGEIIDGLAFESKKYARFNPLLDEHPELLESLDRAWLNKVMGSKIKNHHVLFIGSKGTKTNIHNAGNENIFVQLRGRKRWLLWDQRATYIFNPQVNRAPAKASPLNPKQPDLKAIPGYAHLPTYELILEEGDMLYIPSYLWHYVENLTPTIGIGIRWLAPLSTIKNSPLLSSLELFNTSPNIFKTLNWTKGFDFNKIILENLKTKG